MGMATIRDRNETGTRDPKGELFPLLLDDRHRRLSMRIIRASGIRACPAVAAVTGAVPGPMRRAALPRPKATGQAPGSTLDPCRYVCPRSRGARSLAMTAAMRNDTPYPGRNPQGSRSTPTTARSSTSTTPPSGPLSVMMGWHRAMTSCSGVVISRRERAFTSAGCLRA